MTNELREVVERLTLVDRFDVCGVVWILLRPKGSILGGDLVHGGGTIRVEGEFARSLSTYFKERDAALASGVTPSDGPDPLSEFQEGQWWVKELDAMVERTGTAEQKRAVAVVHHLLRSVRASGVAVGGEGQQEKRNA